MVYQPNLHKSLLRTSCISQQVPSALSLPIRGASYLIIGIVLKEENVHHWQLVDESMALKLLPYAGADSRNWMWDRVHGLNLRGLGGQVVSTVAGHKPSSLFFAICHILPGANLDMPQVLAASRRTNWPLLPVRRQSRRSQVSTKNSHCRVVTANWVGEIAMAAKFVVGVPSVAWGWRLRHCLELDR
jgi:hypothetical protein